MIEAIAVIPKRVLRHKMGYVPLDKTNSETLSSQICWFFIDSTMNQRLEKLDYIRVTPGEIFQKTPPYADMPLTSLQ